LTDPSAPNPIEITVRDASNDLRARRSLTNSPSPRIAGFGADFPSLKEKTGKSTARSLGPRISSEWLNRMAVMAGLLPVSRIMQWSAAACFLLCSLPGAGQTETALTLEDALREAHAANARLPLPAMDIARAREKQNESRAERWLRVAVEGDFIYAPPSGYDPVLTNLGEFRLQAVGRQPIYDGGSRRSQRPTRSWMRRRDATGSRKRISCSM
jgi:hypothetical protein